MYPNCSNSLLSYKNKIAPEMFATSMTKKFPEPLYLGNALLWCCIFLLLESLQGYIHPLYDHKRLQKHFQTCWEAFRTMARVSARLYGHFLNKCENKILTIRILPDTQHLRKICEYLESIRKYPDSQNFTFTFDQEMKKLGYWVFWCFVKVNSVKKLSIHLLFPFCDQKWK